MTRDDLITGVARLMATMAVPVSLPMPLGKAADAWGVLHSGLVGFGWANADRYETEIRTVLLTELRWAPYQEFGIPDQAAETDQAPAGPVTIQSTGFRGNTVIAYWKEASP
jgi:hypothetical protein